MKLKKRTVNVKMRDAILEVVGQIPKGFVITYGLLALRAGYPGRSRFVGHVLSRLPEDSQIPWHRVINARGRVSLRADNSYHRVQQMLLEEEGVVFCNGMVNLSKFCWRGPVETFA